MKGFQLGLILYDNPELGRHAATDVCDQVQLKATNRFEPRPVIPN